MASIEGLGESFWNSREEKAKPLSQKDVAALSRISFIFEHMLRDAGEADQATLDFINKDQPIWREEGAFALRALNEARSIEETLFEMRTYPQLVEKLDLLELKPNDKFNQKTIEYLDHMTKHPYSSEDVKNVYLLYALVSALGPIDAAIQRKFNVVFNNILISSKRDILADLFFQESIPIPYLDGFPITQICGIAADIISKHPRLRQVLSTITSYEIHPNAGVETIAAIIKDSPELEELSFIGKGKFPFLIGVNLDRIKYLSICGDEFSAANLFDVLARAPNLHTLYLLLPPNVNLYVFPATFPHLNQITWKTGYGGSAINYSLGWLLERSNTTVLNFTSKTTLFFFDQLSPEVIQRLQSLTLAMHSDMLQAKEGESKGESLNNILRISNLKELSFFGSDFWEDLDTRLLRDLTSLSVGFTRIPNTKFLDILRNCPLLTQLYIDGGTDGGFGGGLPQKGSLPTHSRLQKLCLMRLFEINEKAVRRLIAHLPALKELHIYHCYDISTQFLDELREQMVVGTDFVALE